MNPPRLTHGATVVTLPHPHAATAPSRELDIRSVSRRTIGGRLRTTLLSHGYAYHLEFRLVPRATYDAVCDLWLAAIAAGAFPTFDYDALWPGAAGRSVAVHPSAATSPLAGQPTLVNFALDLAEVDPR